MPKKAGEKMSKSNYIVRGGADFSKIKQEIEKTRKDLKGFKNQIEGFKTFVGAGLKLAGISLGTAALVKFGQQAIKVASDIEEIQNVTDTVFKEMTKDINEFSKGLIQSHGLGELSAKKYASYMGAMLKSSGVHGDAVRSMSKDLTLLTADMASFYNLDTEEMFQKIMSGMSGQTMPLKKLGINLNIANLEAFALSQGIQKTWKEMTQAEQVMLRYNYLMNVTGDAQGDFARNSWNWAHSIKILSEEWKEFMGLLGTALKEILLPTVQFLIDVVRGLNKIARAIGAIYTMITGNEVAVRSNIGLADSAFDAAEGEEELADGIGKATKAAKKALAPFDEINQIQEDMGGIGSTLGGLLSGANFGDLNTSISTTQVDSGIGNSKKKWEGFFVWIGDWWNNIKQTLTIPIMVPIPIIAPLPDPVYKPSWGLIPPLIPVPVFRPIPNPVYKPNWGLELPPIPQVVFKPIEYGAYNLSLESIKLKTSEGLEWVQSKYNEFTTQLNMGLSAAWDTVESNYDKHKENMGVIATAVSTVLVANINQGLSKLGLNTNNTITVNQNNWQTWGKNLGSIAIETAKSFSANMASGFRTTASNTITFANNQLGNLKSWGSGVLEVAAETSRGFVDNMVSGFITVWNNFKSLMSAMGEKISGFFSANKEVIVKTAIVAGVVVGAGALALAVPAAIPYVAGALGGLASLPALDTGCITGINDPFLAVVGDNKTQREVIAPLDDLKGMLVEAVGSAMMASNQFNMHGVDNPIILQVDGTTFARIIGPYTDKENQRVGNNVIIQPV